MLRGTKKSTMEWLNGKKLHKTLLYSAQLFALQLISIETAILGLQPQLQEPRLSSYLLEFVQQQLPVRSRLRGVWGDPKVGSLTLISITTHKEADSKDPQKF